MHKQVFIYGDDIDTDRIIPGKYTKTLESKELARHAFEDLDPAFRGSVQPGAIVVAGLNFGCGSSREQAAIAIKAAGVAAVIARSFARIFFRNAINIGLPLLEIPDHNIGLDSLLNIDLATGTVSDFSRDRRYQVEPLPAFLQSIIAAGGLVAYMRQHGGYC